MLGMRGLLYGAVVILVASAMGQGSGPKREDGRILFERTFETGQIVCSAGPGVDVNTVHELNPAMAETCSVVYELRLDWYAENQAPVRIWSGLLGAGAPAESSKVRVWETDEQHRVHVMDLALKQGTSGDRSQVIMALRGGASSFSLYQVFVGGGEARSWAPRPDEWSWPNYDIPTKGDPASVTLSFEEGLWTAEVASNRLRTRYRQIAGRWAFEKTKQWQVE